MLNTVEYAEIVKMELAQFGGECLKPHSLGNACKVCEFRVKCSLICDTYRAILGGLFI